MIKNFVGFAKRIKKKWLEIDPSSYWGDNLDVRYYLCWKLQHINNKKILDVGCGSGIILSELNETNKKFGIDISKEKILLAKKINEKSNFVIADMLNLPFKNESFDIVMLNSMFSSIRDIDRDRKKIIQCIYYLLKKGGIFLLTSFNKQHPSYSNYQWLLTFRETENLVKKWFYCETSIGFNPFPRFPFFFPNIIIDKIPFIWEVILFLTRYRYFDARSRGIFIKAIKKTDKI